jgi:hypothetical protein
MESYIAELDNCNYNTKLGAIKFFKLPKYHLEFSGSYFAIEVNL